MVCQFVLIMTGRLSDNDRQRTKTPDLDNYFTDSRFRSLGFEGFATVPHEKNEMPACLSNAASINLNAKP